MDDLFFTDDLHQRNVTQTQVFEKNFKLLHHERKLNQFVGDVDNMLAWLHEVKGNQRRLQSSQGKISSLDFIVKHHRVIYNYNLFDTNLNIFYLKTCLYC
jgi:hypothetical protein